MQRSKVEVFVHYIWTTKRRLIELEPAQERAAHRCISRECERLKCVVRAVNGMPDHVHLVVKLSPTISIARLAQAVKGVSSRMLNDHHGFEGTFDWQDNYGAFGVGAGDLDAVISYVLRQKEHHQSGDIWPEWEENFEFVDED